MSPAILPYWSAIVGVSKKRFRDIRNQELYAAKTKDHCSLQIC